LKKLWRRKWHSAKKSGKNALEYEKSELLLDGELVIYAGSHYDSLVWLKRKNEILCFRQKDVRGRLKVANAKGAKNEV
jgi:hypothetical protein